MTESEFMDLAEATLNEIETALEQAADREDIDVETSRSGNVLEVECVENGSKIIINSQAPMQEIWVAAKSGGFHYKHSNGRWLDTRGGAELFTSLSALLSQQSGVQVEIKPDEP